MSEIDEFLNGLGRDEKDRWNELVKPGMVIIIFGKRGSGKSCLAHWITERFSREHGLLPVVVNFPRDRQSLLPDDFVIRDLREVKQTKDAAVLIDEGSTMIPAGQKKLEELLKGFMALSRQRNQIIAYIFHATADAGSRILRATDLLLFKKPSRRQIEYGSKDNFMRNLLERAKERFDEQVSPERFVFADSEEPEFRGLLENPKPSYWNEGVSRAWAGSSIEMGQPSLAGLELQVEKRKGYKVDGSDNVIYDEGGKYFSVTGEMEGRKTLVEFYDYNKSSCAVWKDPVTEIRWLDFRRKG